MKITKPTDHNGWLDNYTKQVEGDDLLLLLQDQVDLTIAFYQSLEPAQMDFRYAEGKWTPKEILSHLIDTERVFGYRAMSFARRDKTILPGYDEHLYALTTNASQRHIVAILEEYAAARNSTIHLFKSFDAEMLDERGRANNTEMSVRALGYATLGHELHHLRIIRERYLQQVSPSLA
ncbi:MAG: DinB family protein [Flavobacteriales bacterium]|nr:DinB family protein [Flavobacteriales bacterium]